MENFEQILKWIKVNTNKYNISFVNYSWTKEWFDKYYDFSCTFSINGTDYSGRGIDENEKTALIKSFFEAIERYICHQYKFNSTNGMSVHFSKSEAERLSLNELYERDAFFVHFLTNKLGKEITDYSHLSKKFLNICRELDIDLRYFKLNKDENFHVISCLVAGAQCRNKPFGLVIGLGASHDIQNSIYKSTIETSIILCDYLKKNELNTISLKNFLELKYQSPMEHIQLGLNIEYASKLWETMKVGALDILYDSNLSTPQFNFLDLFEFRSLPIYCCKAKMDFLQPLYWGVPKEEDIRAERLTNFGVSLSSLNKLPAPLG